jgi:hypothetical protein
MSRLDGPMTLIQYIIPQMSSIRHALRVIQCSDISQHDWHANQILCNISHSSSPSQAHAVLIDFAATTQATDIDIDHSKDDYGRCIGAIMHEGIIGVDLQWACKYWERDEMKRECWDVFGMGMGNLATGFSWRSRSVDPYKFVYEHTN